MPRLVVALIAVAALLAWGGERYTQEELKAAFYADLGSDAIDVSRYPPEQRKNYGLFAAKCRRCHTLARAVNSPTSSRVVWSLCVARMRLHSRGEPDGCCSKQERKAIVDFLVFDSRERKIRRREDFEKLTQELQDRFARKSEELWRRYEKAHER